MTIVKLKLRMMSGKRSGASSVWPMKAYSRQMRSATHRSSATTCMNIGSQQLNTIRQPQKHEPM